MLLRCLNLALILLCATITFAQRQPVAPQSLREADLHYSKRTWRLIELRERQNKVAAWPRNPLSKILYDAVLTGKLRAYKDDSLTAFFDPEQLVKRTSDTLLVKKLTDPNDNEGLYTIDTVIDYFKPVEQIKQLMIMEEWYFDSRQGQQRAQIIAIAPLYERVISGINIGYIPLCWLKYYDRFDRETDCRDILVNQQMYNAGNPYHTFSYDDWFEQRNFSSFIIKESNPYDVFLMDDPEVKRSGLQRLIEAGKRRQQMLEEEHDMYEH